MGLSSSFLCLAYIIWTSVRVLSVFLFCYSLDFLSVHLIWSSAVWRVLILVMSILSSLSSYSVKSKNCSHPRHCRCSPKIFPKYALLFHLFIYMCVYAHTFACATSHLWRSEKDLQSQLSSSTVCVLVTKLRSFSLATSPFICWAISPAL